MNSLSRSFFFFFLIEFSGTEKHKKKKKMEDATDENGELRLQYKTLLQYMLAVRVVSASELRQFYAVALMAVRGPAAAATASAAATRPPPCSDATLSSALNVLNAFIEMAGLKVESGFADDGWCSSIFVVFAMLVCALPHLCVCLLVVVIFLFVCVEFV